MSLPDLAAGGNSEGQRGYSSGHGSHDDNSVMSAGVSKSNKLTSSTNYHKERRILSTVESSCQETYVSSRNDSVTVKVGIRVCTTSPSLESCEYHIPMSGDEIVALFSSQPKHIRLSHSYIHCAP